MKAEARWRPWSDEKCRRVPLHHYLRLDYVRRARNGRRRKITTLRGKGERELNWLSLARRLDHRGIAGWIEGARRWRWRTVACSDHVPCGRVTVRSRNRPSRASAAGLSTCPHPLAKQSWAARLAHAPGLDRSRRLVRRPEAALPPSSVSRGHDRQGNREHDPLVERHQDAGILRLEVHRVEQQEADRHLCDRGIKWLWCGCEGGAGVPALLGVWASYEGRSRQRRAQAATLSRGRVTRPS